MPPRHARARTVGRRPPGLVVTTVTFLTLLASGCTAEDQEARTPSPAPSPSEAFVDLSGLPVPRAEFCDSLDGAGVTGALGAEVARTAHYGNGDQVEVAPGVVDVAHEHGCVFEAADGTVARAWIFARPVLRREAKGLTRQAVRRSRDCATPDLLVFGRPGLISVCEVPLAGSGSEAGVRARFEGLFTDTWVGCEISEPLVDGASPSPATRPDVVQRAETWCTGLVTTLGAS